MRSRPKQYPLAPGARLEQQRFHADGRVVTRLARSKNALHRSGDRVIAVRESSAVELIYCRGRRGTTAYVEHARVQLDASFDDMDVEALAVEWLTRCGPVVAWCGRCGRPMQASDAMCCPVEAER